jgi:hypothetical protein
MKKTAASFWLVVALGCTRSHPPQPSPTTDPTVLRGSLAARLEASGADPGSSRATTVTQAIREAATVLGPSQIEVAQPTCYRAGCVAPVRIGGEFPSRQHLLARELKTRWKGELYITGPESRGDGVSECSLVVVF